MLMRLMAAAENLGEDDLADLVRIAELLCRYAQPKTEKAKLSKDAGKSTITHQAEKGKGSDYVFTAPRVQHDLRSKVYAAKINQALTHQWPQCYLNTSNGINSTAPLKPRKT